MLLTERRPLFHWGNESLIDHLVMETRPISPATTQRTTTTMTMTTTTMTIKDAKKEDSTTLQKLERIRNQFPEAWIWTEIQPRYNLLGLGNI